MAVLNAAAPRATIATAEATGDRGRWSVHSRGALEGDTSLAGDISVLLDRASLPQSTLNGRFGARSAKLEDAVRDLRRKELLPADIEAVLQGGRATADATLTGTLASPRLEARLTADSLTLGGVQQVRGEAQVRLEGRAVEITRMTAEASGNRLDVHGTATAGNGPIHLAVDARLDRPEVLAAALPAEWRPSGSLVVSGTLDGSPADPRLTARISGSGLDANGIAIDSLEGDVTFAQGILNVNGLRLNRGDGWLRLEAEIDRRLERMRISGRGEKLAVSLRTLSGTSSPPSAARAAAEALHLDDASVEFDVAGSPRQPTGTFSMVAGDVAIDGRALGPVELTARSADRAVRFDLRLPTLSADVSGRIGFEAGWPFEARANLRRSQLTSLAALLERTIALPDTSATVTASADVKGQLNRPLESTGVISIPEIEGQLRGRPLHLIQPGRIRFDGRRPTLEEPLRITLGGFSMGLARVRERESGVLVTLEGRIEDGIAFLPPGMLITPWLVEGPVRAQVSLDQDGDRFAIAGDGDATIDRLMRAEGELARGVHLQARIQGSAIEFSGGDGVVLGAPFSATGRMPLAWAVPAWLAAGAAARGDISPIEATVSARADAMLAPALQALGIKNTNMSGTAKVAIEAHAAEPRLNDVVATVTFEAAEVSVDDLGLTQQAPTRLRFDRGRLEVGALDWKGPRSFLTASGAIGLLPGTEGEFRAEGTSSLAFLRLMAPGIGGEATFQVRVAGPPGARAASAKIDLNDVNIIEPEWQLALAGLSGPLTLEAGVLDTRGLRGQLNGGDFTIEGAVPIRAGTVAPRPLNVEARGLFVEVPKGLRSQLDTRLTWENAASGPRLSGQITIASDSYREPITALASAISAVAPGRAPRLPVAPWVAATALDIRLNSVGPIVVDQSVLNVELVPDVRVTGTVGRPALDGQVTIQDDGRIRVGGRSYRLTESRLEFSPAAGLLPRLNLIGETHVSSYLVTLRMVGPADQIETNFSSDPPLSERDVRSLLVTGQIADPARGTTDSNTFAVGAVSGDVLGVAGQFVGLDTVSVGTEDLDLVSSDVDPATRLTVSKRLGTKFELVLSENLEENESTWIVIYRPVSGYEFRLSSEENTKEAFEFRQEITFGPGVPTRTRARAATVVQDKDPLSGTRWRTRLQRRAGAGGYEAATGRPLRVSSMAGGSRSHRAVLPGQGVLHRARRSDAHSGREQRQGASRRSPVPHRAWTTDGARSHGVRGRRRSPQSPSADVVRQRGARPAGRQAHQGNPRASHRCRVPPRPDRGRGRSTRQRHRSRTRPHRPRPAHGLPPACVPRQPGARDSDVAGAHSVGSTRCQRVDGSGPADRCDPRGIRGEGLPRGARHHRANRVRGRRGDVADSDRRGAGGAGGGGPADGRCARAAGWSARGDRPCRGVAICRRGGSIRTRPAGALLPRPRISRRARGDDGDRRVAGNGHGAHVRGERGAAPRDQLRRDRGRAVDQAVARQQGRSADAGPTGRRGRRRGNREAAVRARDLPARRSSTRAGSCAWAGPGGSSGQGDRLARGDASLPVALRARAVVGVHLGARSAHQRAGRCGGYPRSQLPRPGDVARRGAAVRARPAERASALLGADAAAPPDTNQPVPERTRRGTTGRAAQRARRRGQPDDRAALAGEPRDRVLVGLQQRLARCAVDACHRGGDPRTSTASWRR